MKKTSTKSAANAGSSKNGANNSVAQNDAQSRRNNPSMTPTKHKKS